jgi:hypothetical protein
MTAMLFSWILISTVCVLLSTAQHISDGNVDGYLIATRFGDDNCGEHVLSQNFHAYGQCFQHYDGKGEYNNVIGSFEYYFDRIDNSLTDFKEKQINYTSSDCTGNGTVALKIPGKVLTCEENPSIPGGTQEYLYAPTSAPYLSAYGYYQQQYRTYDECLRNEYVSSEHVYQSDACISTGIGDDVEYSRYTCDVSSYTQQIYSDQQCTSLLSAMTYPFPAPCQDMRSTLDNNMEAFQTVSCKPQEKPTGYIHSIYYSDTTCQTAIRQGLEAMGFCYQNYNASIMHYNDLMGEFVGSEFSLWMPEDGNLGKKVTYNFNDTRCKINMQKESAIPITTGTCVSVGDGISAIHLYVDGSVSPIFEGSGIKKEFYSTEEHCVSGLYPTSQYIYPTNVCIKTYAGSEQYSVDGNVIVTSLYSDSACGTPTSSTRNSSVSCKSHIDHLNNNYQAFETMEIYSSSSSPSTSTQSSLNDGEISGITVGVLVFAVLIAAGVYYYFKHISNEDKIVNKEAASSGVVLQNTTIERDSIPNPLRTSQLQVGGTINSSKSREQLHDP